MIARSSLLALLFCLASSAQAQVVWMMPAWTPIRPVIVPVQVKVTQPRVTIERYYIAAPAAENAPANSTQSEEAKPPASFPSRLYAAGSQPEIIIREYYLWEDRATPAESKPEKLTPPPWNDSFEAPPADEAKPLSAESVDSAFDSDPESAVPVPTVP